MKKIIFICLLLTYSTKLIAQINENKIGSWYMYFFSHSKKDKVFGFQGDIQFRNWNMGGDLEQLLLRGGFTIKPKNAIAKYTLGYGNIITGDYGSGTATNMEHRIYQEMLYPVKVGNRFYTSNRFRFEQRLRENEHLRTRFRYNLFLNIPLNKTEIVAKTFYLAFYNELFINGQKNVGNGNYVELFDRNRLYTGVGYKINNGMKVQLALMNQTTDSWAKNQMQFSLHHNF